MATGINRVLIAVAIAALVATACSSDDSPLEASAADDGPSAADSTTPSDDETGPSETVADGESTSESTAPSGSDSTGLPETPEDVRVQIDNSDVVLRWSDAGSGVSYVVARDSRELGSTTEPMFRDEGLEDGAYRYQVFAVGSGGESSEPFNVVAQVGLPDVFPPSDPTGVEIQVLDGRVLMTWNESLDDRGVRGYLVHRNRDFYAWVTGDLKFVDNDVEPNQTYRYRVRAQDDAANNSAPVGGIVSTGPPDVAAPSVPEVIDVDVQGAIVTIEWAEATDDREIWGYLVHRDGIFHAWVAEETVFSEPVVPGSMHKYVIRSQDGAGNNSDPSDVVDIAVG